MAPIDRSYTTLYWFAIVNITLSCTIFELFDVQNIVTLKSWLRAIQELKITEIVPFESLGTVSYSPSIATTVVSFAISEIFSVR